ncbi:MAG: CAP domain-containing protein [Paracoccaceae bacterium]|nr:CAP domain-containing protein [Paracoccaceae bacterium]
MSSSTLRLCWVKALLVSLALAPVLPMPVAAGVEETVLAGINAARAKAGCAPLRINAKLMAAAKSHARAMAEQNFFGHTGKDGSRFSNRIKRQGYSYRAAAENIAAGQKSASQVVGNWLGSSGHRRNILNCRLKETGIAVVYQPDDAPIRGQRQPLRYYWVQVFAAPR